MASASMPIIDKVSDAIVGKTTPRQAARDSIETIQSAASITLNQAKKDIATALKQKTRGNEKAKPKKRKNQNRLVESKAKKIRRGGNTIYHRLL